MELELINTITRDEDIKSRERFGEQLKKIMKFGKIIYSSFFSVSAEAS